jgi:hypothetical protein
MNNLSSFYLALLPISVGGHFEDRAVNYFGLLYIFIRFI